ncbi:MAG: thioredoxin domain-containing protein [Patescibacteria group bacterium]
MNKGFYWIIAVIVIFIGLLAFAAFYKNKSATGLPIPTEEVSLSDWTVGTSTTVVLMEYSDFQCPACRSYFPIVEQIVSEYKDRITFVYRHFPLAQHLNAMTAARASEASGRQGKFWEMYVLLFQNQDVWSGESKSLEIFKGYATELNLDLERFVNDYNDPSLRGKIQNDYKSGVKLGVDSTPSFFLNGEKIANPEGNTVEEILSSFRKALDEALFSATKVTLPTQ